MIRRRPTAPTSPLTPSVLSLLARGWGDYEQDENDPDPFQPWTLSHDDMVRLYHQHSQAVDAEAARAGRSEAWITEYDRWLEQVRRPT